MDGMNKITKATIALTMFATTIPAANWLIGNVGITCVPDGPCLIPIGFGLMAPSGVLMIGLALVLRDWVQELTNWKWSALAVFIGAFISYLMSDPFIALASAVAFLTSEMFDLAIYTPLRKKGRSLAVLVSGVVGSFVDSLLFVYIAFGSLDFAIGNTLGKIYASFVVAIYLFIRSRKHASNT
jgi:uncharacterized PurR-regulated membrane protein YhhQ (DUF165 family)